MAAVTAQYAEPPGDLPPVDGRHRNRVLAARRRALAVQLVTEGWTYQRVADHMGYSNRGTVYSIVQQALQRHEAEDVEFHRKVALGRLNELRNALWDRMEQSDVRAVLALLQIEDRWCRLLGLFPDSTEVREGYGRCGRPNTVVAHAECMTSQCPDHWPVQS